MPTVGSRRNAAPVLSPERPRLYLIPALAVIVQAATHPRTETAASSRGCFGRQGFLLLAERFRATGGNVGIDLTETFKQQRNPKATYGDDAIEGFFPDVVIDIGKSLHQPSSCI